MGKGDGLCLFHVNIGAGTAGAGIIGTGSAGSGIIPHRPVMVRMIVITPIEIVEEEQKTKVEQEQYLEETRVEVKPSLWQRIKQSKVARALTYLFKIRITVDTKALPEGKGE